jgi:hypothetical protein
MQRISGRKTPKKNVGSWAGSPRSRSLAVNQQEEPPPIDDGRWLFSSGRAKAPALAQRPTRLGAGAFCFEVKVSPLLSSGAADGSGFGGGAPVFAVKVPELAPAGALGVAVGSGVGGSAFGTGVSAGPVLSAFETAFEVPDDEEDEGTDLLVPAGLLEELLEWWIGLPLLPGCAVPPLPDLDE